MTEEITRPTGYMEEAPGVKSFLRMASFTCLLQALIFSWYILIRGDTSGNGMYLTVMFMLAAFAPKVIQKFAENMPKLKQ
ncbi:MAG: hypothetical protein EHM41_00090 [Chloroflexi bacterium]|nr:MAG: hypothetical protein EHM41_00090 [Chloroflexota bacterium]